MPWKWYGTLRSDLTVPYICKLKALSEKVKELNRGNKNFIEKVALLFFYVKKFVLDLIEIGILFSIIKISKGGDENQYGI